jgi:hypothetical protein
MVEAAREEHNLEMRQDVQRVYDWKDDERWTYVDKAGHAHKWDNGYPSLVDKSEHIPCDCCDDYGYSCDGYDRYWKECALCGEVIRPTVEPATIFLAGRIQCFIDGVQVSREEYDRVLGQSLADTT